MRAAESRNVHALVLVGGPLSVHLGFWTTDALGLDTASWSLAALIAMLVVPPSVVGIGLGRLTYTPAGVIWFVTALSIVATFVIAVILLARGLDQAGI